MIEKEHVIEALRNVFDPEVPVNVWDLGLVYDIQVKENDLVYVKMTMTSPGCPFAAVILQDVEKKVKELAHAKTVDIELTFNPMWNPETMMTPEGKAQMEVLQ